MKAALFSRQRDRKYNSAPISDPIFASVGDSRTQFGAQAISLQTGFTITRDAAGKITLAKTGHGINGDQKIFLANLTDNSYNVMGDGHWVAADTYEVQTTVTGAAGSTTATGSNSFAVKMGCLTGRGVIENLQAITKGGIKYLGAWAQGGMLASAMGPECDAACATNAQFIILEAGINDSKGSVAASTIAASVNTLIDKITTAGKTAIVLNISLLGSTYGAGYGAINDNSIAANALIAAHCNGTTSIYVDTSAGLKDTGTSSPNISAWLWAVTDGTHAHTRAAMYEAQQIIATAGSKFTINDLLPVVKTTVPYTGAVANTTIVRDYTLWTGFYTTTTSGFFTGTTGTRANNTNVSRSVGTPSTVMSVVADPGDGKGAISRIVIQPAAAGDRAQFVFNTTSETLATVGLAAGDSFVVACEVYNYTNWDLSQASALWIGGSSNGGTFAFGFGGNDNTTTEPTVSGTNVFYGDTAGPFYLVSGVMKVPASGMTALSVFVNVQFAGTTASQPLTVDLRRGAIIKLPLGY